MINSRLRRMLREDDRPSRQLSRRRFSEKIEMMNEAFLELNSTLHGLQGVYNVGSSAYEQSDKEKGVREALKHFKRAKKFMSKIDPDERHFDELADYMDAVDRLFDIVDNDFMKVVGKIEDAEKEAKEHQGWFWDNAV